MEEKKMKVNRTLKLREMTILILSIVILSGCLEGILGPKPVVESVECNKRLQGLNAVTGVNVLVTNRGGAGEVIVEAKFLSNKGRTYNDTQVIYMDKGESKYVNFVFDTTLDEEGTCSATARHR